MRIELMLLGIVVIELLVVGAVSTILVEVCTEFIIGTDFLIRVFVSWVFLGCKVSIYVQKP